MIFLTSLWRIPERSLIKSGQLIKEQAARLAACINDIDALAQLLSAFTERFQIGCRQNTQKSVTNKHSNRFPEFPLIPTQFHGANENRV